MGLRKIFLLALLCVSFFVKAQVLQQPNTYGIGWKRTGADTLLYIPSDTLNVPAWGVGKAHIAKKGTALYYWDGSKWSAITGGSSTYTAGNGLTLSGSQFKLGGSLSDPQTEIQIPDGTDLIFQIGAAGQFFINDDGSGDTILYARGNDLRLPIIPSGSSTDSVLVWTAGTGQVKKRNVSSLVSTPTLQQVLTAGGTLTTNNTIDANNTDFDITNAASVKISGNGAGNVSFVINQSGIDISTERTQIFGYINNDNFSQIDVISDSILYQPYKGKMNIDSLRTWSGISDTLYKKPMTWDTRNGRWEYAANWYGGGGSTLSNIGSGYRLAVPGTNNIKTLFFPYSVKGDSTSNSNALTLYLENDTASLPANYYYGSNSVGRRGWYAKSGLTVPISSLTTATSTNSVNVGSYGQEWYWNSLANSYGLSLYSINTGSSGSTQTLFQVVNSGANINSNQTTKAAYFNNAHTGTNSTNIGIYAAASGGTNNYALVVPPGEGSVGIGTLTPSASSLMELSSTTAGLLIPRMNTTQQNAISTPATGLLIYNTDSATIVQYNGSAWRKLGTGGESGWSLTGNAGTTAGTNFIGTTDAVDLVFKVNSIEKMRATATGIRIPQALAVGNNGGDTILYCIGGDTYIGGSYNNQNHGHFNENFFTYTNASGNENYLYIEPSSKEFSVGLNYNSQFGKRIFVNGLQRKITIGDVDNVNNGVILAIDDANENIIADKARVGIGTLSPTAWLDVQDADGAIATGIFNAHEDRSGEIVNIQQASTKKFSFNTSGAIEMQEQSSAPSTPASGYVSVYANSSNSQLYLKNDAATEKQLITSVNLLFGGGGNMDSDTTFFTTSAIYGSFYNDADTIVVTSFRAVLQGTSPDVTYKIWYNDSLNVEAGATALNTSGNQVTSTTTGTNVTSITNTKIPPGVWVWVKTSTVATKPKYFSLTLNGYRK